MEVAGVLDVRALLEEKTDDGTSLAPVLEIDLGNLLVFDHQEQPRGSEYVKEQAESCIQRLFDKLFNCPVIKSDAGPLAELPLPTTPIPREKPIPQPKPPTKWELFAKEKGIQKKQKRSRLKFDEVSGEYKPRYGKGRAADPVADSWVLDDKPQTC
jgi:regulator of ribosome biosynthesis